MSTLDVIRLGLRFTKCEVNQGGDSILISYEDFSMQVSADIPESIVAPTVAMVAEKFAQHFAEKAE